MKCALKLSSSIIKCIYCQEKYDLTKAVRNAELLKQRKVKCPNCNKNIGTI